MSRTRALVGLLVALAAACGGDAAAPTTAADSTATTAADASTSSTTESEEYREVVVPNTTKVLDPESATALAEVTPDGILRFSAVTPYVAALAPGDVIVAGVTPATPYGLLRTVRTIELEGGGATITTDGALLTDAVHRGSFSYSGTFGAEDAAAISLAMPGVRMLPAIAPAAIGGRGATAGPRGLPARGALTPIALSFDSDLGTGGTVRITGSASITPIVELSGSISCDDTTEVPFVGEVCSEIPDLNFSVGLGIQQSTNLALTGTAAASFNERVEVGTFPFVPIVIPIGPVPLVLTPSVTLYLQTDATLAATLDYGVGQNLLLVAGFSYNSDSGFGDASRHDGGFSQQRQGFSGSLRARAALGAQFDVRLYGVVGPFAALEAGIDFEADPAGLAAVDTARWQAEGCLRLLVGIDSIDVIDLRYEKELLRACTEFARGAPNSTPSVTLAYPTAGSEFAAGETVPLIAQAIDLDGDALNCTWASSVPADAFPVSGCSGVSGSFATPGPRTLTVTVTDGYRTATASVAVTVATPQAISVSVTSPQLFAELDPHTPITVTGSAVGGTPPYTTLWAVMFPTDEAGNGGTERTFGDGFSRTWLPASTLTVQNCATFQSGVVTLYVVDSLGAYGWDEVIVRFLGNGPC